MKHLAWYANNWYILIATHESNDSFFFCTNEIVFVASSAWRLATIYKKMFWDALNIRFFWSEIFDFISLILLLQNWTKFDSFFLVI